MGDWCGFVSRGPVEMTDEERLLERNQFTRNDKEKSL